MSAGGRSGGDSALIAALAGGATHEAAAKQAGVSERTVRRRLGDAGFRRQIDEARAELLVQAMAQLSRAATGAATTLVLLLGKDTPATVRLGREPRDPGYAAPLARADEPGRAPRSGRGVAGHARRRGKDRRDTGWLAMAGIGGRLARLEARLDAVVLDFMASRPAGETRPSSTGDHAELRALMHQLARLGPNPDARSMAQLIAWRIGSDEERVYRDLIAIREKRRS